MSKSARTILRRFLIVAAAVAIAGIFYWNSFYNDRVIARESSPSGAHEIVLLSRSHTLDRIYMSMQGPFSNHGDIDLASGEIGSHELLWLTGIRADLVGRDGGSPMSREFFCHSNLTLNLSHLIPQRAGSDPDFTPTQDYRLFTMIPGRMEITLPAGFGVPVYADEALDYLSMSLNMNQPTGSRDIRFKSRISHVRDHDAAGMKPLFRRAVYGFEPIGKESPHTMCSGGNAPGAACGPFVGQAASNSFVASLGKTNTIHWLIPSGHYESRVLVKVQLELPFDTTVHYVTAHLHPYGKSVALFDATTKQTVFEIKSINCKDRVGVDVMEELKLPQGVPVFKDHEYELVTTYHNPTDKPIDAMSILYLYCLDKKFEARHAATAAGLARR